MIPLTSPGWPAAPLANLPAADRALFERIGPAWAQDVPGHIAATVEVYTRLAAAGPKNGVAVTRDEAYGPHPRQRIDLFAPRAASGAEVVVFVHGGAFVRGDKNVTGELYDNVCYWFARQGLVAVNLEYRLAGDAPFPGGAEDVALAVEHLAGRVAALGGNPRRMFLIGHSAGGCHVATYCCSPASTRALHGGVAGVVLLSARLRADVLSDNPNAAAVRAYFGADEGRYDQLSPVSHAAGFPLPLMIAIAQYENPHLDTYGAEMLYRVLAARGNAPRFVQMMGHNHISIAAHFNSGEDYLGREILAFMRSVPS